MEESHPTRNTTQSILTATNEHAAMPPVKQKRITFWLFITLTFALFTFIALSLFGPNPPIEISVATTHLTTPLAADGYPDYAAVLKADRKKGVTPENNGAILFLRSMWPEYDEDFTVEDGELLCEELGMEGPPPIGDRLTKFDTPKNRIGALRLLRKHLLRKEPTAKEILDNELGVIEKKDPETELFLQEYYEGLQRLPDSVFFDGVEEVAVKDMRVVDLLSNCQPLTRSWTKQEIPFVADWLDLNQSAIDRLVDAAFAPEWYLPAIKLLATDRERQLSISMYSMSALRNTARILCTRSNYHLGIKRYDLAIQDAVAIIRIGNHLNRASYLVDQLVAIAIAGVGIEQVNRIASDPDLPSKQARKLLAELNSIPPVGRMIKTINGGERFYGLNSLLIDEGRSMAESFFADQTETSVYIAQILGTRTKVDWNVVLTQQNSYLDSILAAAKLPTWQQQQAQFDQIQSERESRYEENNRFLNLGMMLLTPEYRGDYLADHTIDALHSSIAPCFFAEVRARNRMAMSKLAVALAIYRAEQGSYPLNTELLVPSILPEMPIDKYQRKAFCYRVLDSNSINIDSNRKGFLLYSLGPNGIDNGGSCTEESSYSGGPCSFQGQTIESWGPPSTEDQKLISKIPENADDPSLRIPLRVEPWPWESIIEEYSVPE